METNHGHRNNSFSSPRNPGQRQPAGIVAAAPSLDSRQMSVSQGPGQSVLVAACFHALTPVNGGLLWQGSRGCISSVGFSKVTIWSLSLWAPPVLTILDSLILHKMDTNSSPCHGRWARLACTKDSFVVVVNDELQLNRKGQAAKSYNTCHPVIFASCRI